MSIKSAIITLLIHSGPTPRAELARRLGISPSRITEVTASLLDEGILCTAGFMPNKSRGRKSVLLDLDCSYKFALGISIHDGAACVGLTTVKGDILGQAQEPYTDDSVSAVKQAVSRIMSECSIGYDKIIGVGLCAKSDTSHELTKKLREEFSPLPFVFEPSDSILTYSEQYLPIHLSELFKFGCAKVIRDVFIK